VFIIPGRKPTGKEILLVGTVSLCLSQRSDCDQIVVAFTDHPQLPPPEILSNCIEVVLVKRTPSSTLAFRAALEQTAHKWKPQYAELDHAHLASYVESCAPAVVTLT
jgi:hypothetical protein